MNHATKAALLSGLVFPGLGHWYVKRYAEGLLLCGGAAYALYFIVAKAVDSALAVVEKLQRTGVPPDVATITDMVSQQLSGSEQALDVATWALLVLWLLGIVDAYRRGRARDRADALSSGV